MAMRLKSLLSKYMDLRSVPPCDILRKCALSYDLDQAMPYWSNLVNGISIASGQGILVVIVVELPFKLAVSSLDILPVFFLFFLFKLARFDLSHLSYNVILKIITSIKFSKLQD